MRDLLMQSDMKSSRNFRCRRAIRSVFAIFWLLTCGGQLLYAKDQVAITLGELLRSNADQHNINFVLEQGLTLDQIVNVQQHNWRDPGQLDAILAEAGLRQRINQQGDRLILRRTNVQLQLSELEIEARQFSAGGARPNLGQQLASSTVIDAISIARNGDNQVNDLFLRAANVFGARDDFFIRGVARNGDLNTLGNANVFSDGVPLPDHQLANLPVSTWDIEQVSFERGSLSARQPGPFASYAGAVYMRHLAPAYENKVGFLLRYDELEDSQLAAVFNRQLREEELALRFSIDRLSKAGSLAAADGSRRDVDEANSLSARASVLWEPIEMGNLRVIAALNAVDGDAGPQSFVLHQQGSLEPFDRRGFFSPIERKKISSWQADLKLEYEDTGGRDWNVAMGGSDSRLELDTTRNIANELLPDFDLVDRSDNRVFFLNLGVAQDFERLGRFDLEASVGVVSEQEQVDRDRALWRIDSELERFSLSLAYQHQFGTEIEAYFKMRYDRDTLRNRCNVFGEGSGSVDGSSLSCTRLLGFYVSLLEHQALDPLRTDFDQWSPELALSWRANDLLEFFGRAYRGYNAGGAASSVTLSGQPFYIIYSPERSDNLELGADLEWADGRLSGRLTAFYTTLSNQWTPLLGGADFPLGQIDNSGHSRLYGLEWDARFQIDARHQLQMSLGFLKTQHVNFIPFER